MDKDGAGFFVIPENKAPTITAFLQRMREVEWRSPMEKWDLEAELATLAAEIASHQIVCPGEGAFMGWVAVGSFLDRQLPIPDGNRFLDPAETARVLASLERLRKRLGGDLAIVERAAAEDPDGDAEVAESTAVYTAYCEMLSAAAAANAFILSTTRPPGITLEPPEPVPRVGPPPDPAEVRRRLKELIREGDRRRVREMMEDRPSPFEESVFVIPTVTIAEIRAVVQQIHAIPDELIEEVGDNEVWELREKAHTMARTAAVRGSTWGTRDELTILGNLSKLWLRKLTKVYEMTKVWRPDEVPRVAKAAAKLEKQKGGMGPLVESLFPLDPGRAEPIYAQVMYLFQWAAEHGHGVAWLSWLRDPWALLE